MSNVKKWAKSEWMEKSKNESKDNSVTHRNPLLRAENVEAILDES